MAVSANEQALADAISQLILIVEELASPASFNAEKGYKMSAAVAAAKAAKARLA